MFLPNFQVFAQDSPKISGEPSVSTWEKGELHELRKLRKKVKTHKGGIIFRAWIRLKDGKIIYARDYGLRGFPIRT